MNITLDMNNGRAVFFLMQGSNTQANLCKKWFLPSNHQNDNVAPQKEKFLCNTNGTNNAIKLRNDDVV